MVSLNTENIVKIAENSFVKKTFGGITPESAKEALNKVTNEVKKLADDAVGAVQKELEAYKGKTAREMAELTSKKDAVILSKDAKLTEVSEKLETANAAIKQAKATKVGKSKKLKNGNIATSKVNKNGAKMTTETTVNGEKVSVTVENLDGDIRKTKYNLATGKPKSTYSNTNGEKLIEYDTNGNFKKISDVNIKKGSVEKPKVISDELVDIQSGGSRHIRKRTYSDGSYETVGYDPVKFVDIDGTKYNSSGQKVEIFGTGYNNGKPYKVVKNIDPVSDRVTHGTITGEGIKEEKFYSNGTLYKKTELTPDGLKRTITAPKDKYGNVNAGNPPMKYTYPKDSQIKDSVLNFESRFCVADETVKLRNGSTVKVKYDSNYIPYDLEIATKSGDITKIHSREEAQKYLDSIGKVGYEQDKQYFNNWLI